MRDLATAIDNLADEDPSEIPKGLLTEQLLELHWQMARLQAQIARRTGLRGWSPVHGDEGPAVYSPSALS